ncbi:MAG TPA: tyrosine-type recombinase/integrase [Fimbriimonadaceae bacterium]|nr:tyrosine-type recombinase/integrase [Fimbriimonadaceae bacterium]
MATLRADGRYTQGKRVPGKKSPIYGYGATAEEAEQDLLEKVEAYTRSIAEPQEVPTLAETFHQFAKRCWFPQIEGLGKRTVKRYTGCYCKHIRPRIGFMPIREIRFDHLQSVVNDMRREKKDDGSRTVGDQTIRYAMTLIGQILNLAVDLDVIVKSPAKRVKRPGKTPKRHRRLSVEKAIKVLEATKGTPLGAPVFLAMVLGMREGEVAAAKWEYLDRQQGEFTVHVQRQRLSGGGCEEVACKHDSFRTLRPTRELVHQLDEVGDLDHRYICTRNGEAWYPETISEYWRAKRSELEMENWTYHDLRHCAAGLLHAAGCDLLEIGQVLGHKNPDMSWLYTSTDEDSERTSMARLTALMGWKQVDERVQEPV